MTQSAGRRRRPAGRGKSWVRKVRETSDAMDLPVGIFGRSSAGIARGLKRAVLRSRRTKGTKLQSAMSMLNLYINRAGRAVSRRDRIRLEAAKDELRNLFGRTSGPSRRDHARRRLPARSK
jgi:Protein of unknown function (DUF3175)